MGNALRVSLVAPLMHSHAQTNFEVTAGQFHEEPLFGGRPIWYLSADAAEVLPEELPADGVVLVVGGLVDRNRHKGIT